MEVVVLEMLVDIPDGYSALGQDPLVFQTWPGSIKLTRADGLLIFGEEKEKEPGRLPDLVAEGRSCLDDRDVEVDQHAWYGERRE